MVLLRCCTTSEARRSIDWSVLIVIGSAIGIGTALEKSGAAAAIAYGLLNLAGGNPLLALVAVYLATMFCTELITNNAAAVLMFPIAINAATGLGSNPTPFVIVVMIAASASFLVSVRLPDQYDGLRCRRLSRGRLHQIWTAAEPDRVCGHHSDCSPGLASVTTERSCCQSQPVLA